jgi:hypothetical protein
VIGSIGQKDRRRERPASGSGPALIHEKTVVLTPMPTPSEPMMTAATPGAAAIARQAWRKSRPNG